MTSNSKSHSQERSRRIPIWLGFCLFAVIALFLLWEEHRAHILGAFPYALLLLCPIIHLFMHGRHGDHGRDSGQRAKSSADRGDAHESRT